MIFGSALVSSPASTSGLKVSAQVALAPHTSLELGGPAQYFCEATSRRAVVVALRWARKRGLPVTVIGGGSNLVVADSGFPGLVLAVRTRGVELVRHPDGACAHAEAGEPWDALVQRTVDAGLCGLECLSGIPGLVGATPVQNIGAYGVELADCLSAVEVLDREHMQSRWWSPADCSFAYRHSCFKATPERYIVLAVRLRLRTGLPETPRYAELARVLANRGLPLDVAAVRQAVLALRSKKSMCWRADDPNRRSAGSFFTNPILTADQFAALQKRLPAQATLPSWPQPHGRHKVAAAWLIEAAGFAKGHRVGQVGISSRHALALVQHGGATTHALMTLAGAIQTAVQQRFGVHLEPEPRLLGFARRLPWASPSRTPTP